MGEFQFCITGEPMGLADGLEIGRKGKTKIHGVMVPTRQIQEGKCPSLRRGRLVQEQARALGVTLRFLFWACEA